MVASSIIAKPGRDLLIKIADPAVSPSVYVSVAGVRNVQINVNNNPADITNHDSQGFREWLPNAGIQEYQITFDGVMALGNSAFNLFNEMAINRTLAEFQIVSSFGNSYLFAGVINTVQRAGNTQDAETFNCTLTSHGQITYVPAP